MNDTINILPHTTCQVSYCNKPVQLTTPEEDVDMLIRRERESSLSPEPDANPNPYSAELLNLKQERTLTKRQKRQNLELEEVLNKELTGLTVEGRVIELRLTLEDDQAWRKEEKEDERELKEKETSDLIYYIGELQKEYREGHKEVIGVLAIQVAKLMTQLIAPLPLSPLPPPPLISESFFTSPMEEIQYIIVGTAEEAAETLMRAEKVVISLIMIIPDSTGSRRESLLAQLLIPFPLSFYQLTGPGPTTSPTREIRYMTVGMVEEIVETLARAKKAEALSLTTVIPDSPITIPIEGSRAEPTIEITEKPSKDSYVEDNSPICNLGASGPSPNIPSMESIKFDVKAKNPDIHMTNNIVECQLGLPASQHTTTVTKKSPRKPQIEDEIKPKDKSKTVEANVIATAQKGVISECTATTKGNEKEAGLKECTNRAQDIKEKEDAKERIGGSRGRNSNRRPSRWSTPIGWTIPPAQDATHPGTSTNAIPIGPSREKTLPSELSQESIPLARGKPGRIERTYMGKGYWEQGPKNMADIENTSRLTSIQVLLTGCPTVPTRGDGWKRSFIAGFNAKRECLALEMPI
ncbi:hypothetical protein L211DRAFT_849799 [Terfezia boudieri ATCC MYA-4762]|uniref:Uncharacterized protein n=1 Tax=Terfezia boudieri ATCC MYA-4762 TaxID=1051890 RepID=A0A3N4LL79_9PEZI|nr:hypothetical protein L211DRAFT_849799 [Terfezia boudieri ATCC MYA-4762]